MMTIYPLIPKELDNTTLGKQIEAIAQTLCNVHWIIGRKEDGFYTKNFLKNFLADPHTFLAQSENAKNCKFTQWASECRANYLELVGMAVELISEYYYRLIQKIQIL